MRPALTMQLSTVPCLCCQAGDHSPASSNLPDVPPVSMDTMAAAALVDRPSSSSDSAVQALLILSRNTLRDYATMREEMKDTKAYFKDEITEEWEQHKADVESSVQAASSTANAAYGMATEARDAISAAGLTELVTGKVDQQFEEIRETLSKHVDAKFDFQDKQVWRQLDMHGRVIDDQDKSLDAMDVKVGRAESCLDGLSAPLPSAPISREIHEVLHGNGTDHPPMSLEEMIRFRELKQQPLQAPALAESLSHGVDGKLRVFVHTARGVKEVQLYASHFVRELQQAAKVEKSLFLDKVALNPNHTLGQVGIKPGAHVYEDGVDPHAGRVASGSGGDMPKSDSPRQTIGGFTASFVKRAGLLAMGSENVSGNGGDSDEDCPEA